MDSLNFIRFEDFYAYFKNLPDSDKLLFELEISDFISLILENCENKSEKPENNKRASFLYYYTKNSDWLDLSIPLIDICQSSELELINIFQSLKADSYNPSSNLKFDNLSSNLKFVVFSRKKDDLFCWSHYGNGGKGLCYTVEFNDLVAAFISEFNSSGNQTIIIYGKERYEEDCLATNLISNQSGFYKMMYLISKMFIKQTCYKKKNGYIFCVISTGNVKQKINPKLKKLTAVQCINSPLNINGIDFVDLKNLKE